MLASTLIAGFMLGAAGSLHCVGMCGPLSLALPTGHLPASMKFMSLMLYQFGRIVTYSLFGLIFGLAGRGVYLAGLQQWFSIIAGSIILVSAVLYFMRKRPTRFVFFNRFHVLVQQFIIKILKRNSSPAGFLLLGIANGFLPCGMVYMALAAALSFVHTGLSVGFMAMFGAGTLPAMLFVGYSRQIVKPQFRSLFKRFIPYVITLVGIMMILRGLNLGVVFLSPQLPGPSGSAVICPP